MTGLPDERLPRAFYTRDALVVARALVGTLLVHRHRVARIVETEAYRGPKDLACHARAGMTKRTRTLYGPAGHAYVFLIYGMYECFNVVCFGEGKGHAVLVRGVEPVLGIPDDERSDGPGRLTRALGITRNDNAVDLVESEYLWLAPRTKRPRIAASARVGVAYAGEIADAPWRFFDPTSRYVSRPSARSIGLGLSVPARPRPR
ncbi:MAG: DNA-3-methyladenine glycosylase [Labilithrix sp.]|nr:DNA-3-methyladenine glycosylase [Labilithrix sp.]